MSGLEQYNAVFQSNAALQSAALNNQTMPQRPAMIEELRNLLGRLGETINTAENATAAVRERYLGAWPESPTPAANNQIKGPPSHREELITMLESLIDKAQRVSDHAHALNFNL